MKQAKKIETKGNVTWLTGFVNALRLDGWANVFTGMGLKSKDSRKYSSVTWRRMCQADIENLYAGDAMAAKIVDLPVDQSMECGYKVTGLSTEEEKKLEMEKKRLKLDDTVIEAKKKARMYGGCLILKVYDDDLRLDTPRDPNS